MEGSGGEAWSRWRRGLVLEAFIEGVRRKAHVERKTVKKNGQKTVRKRAEKRSKNG